ncbi:MAG TPA: glutathione S-transferase family protein [Stellaceae bacterium]|jgi:glutathione S-transferase|nr:glutathione S-transferase family protein [Stellaceae bacterium]
MLKIWGRTTSSNVQKVLWACAEMNIPFERVDAGLHFGRNRDPEYLALNPNGLVPTIEDGKAIVWESNAILRYLAATRGFDRLHPKDPVERSHVERWMDWQLSVLGPPMGTLLMGYYRTPPERRDAAALDTAHTRAAAAWRILEGQLKDGKPYVAGKELTLADISLGMFVHRWYSYPVERPPMPHLKAWYDRLGARPAYKTHIMIPVS